MRGPLELDDATVRALEIHETYAHAVGDRVVRDLGDCYLLHSPTQADPYVNRIAAIRWPEERDAFDRRVAEVLTLFAGLDRRPHVWTAPAHRRPADLEERLRAVGFRDAGDGAFVMLRTAAPAPMRLAAGLSVERVAATDPRARESAWIREVALVLARSFAFPDDEVPSIQRDIEAASVTPGMTTVVLRDGGDAVAAGRAFVRDGLAYLLSIGTDPLAAGRGLGTIVTATLAADAAAAGARYVYLAVRTQNDRALSVYRRCGFEIVGGPAGELILA